eukprot:TRINITY_DN14184_c0_g1_i1.p1 TRINITY_DN14184_c0_g1~~TRINITY_DN14184_c0_g1_i1.p1  ORF type:complete len:1300 (+),score=351.95 TRINITY_DN14184_c0_g1_i1:140-4039(+)
MEGVQSNDAKATRGMEIIEGKVLDHSAMNVLEKTKSVRFDDELGLTDKFPGSTKKDATKGSTKKSENQAATDMKSPKKAGVGLDLGRRLMVVMKNENANMGASSPSVPSTTSVRVVDHGASQKEAIRRLFDAQVLLQSYEEQLENRDEQLLTIQTHLKKIMRDHGGEKLRDPELVAALGLTIKGLEADDGIRIPNKSKGDFDVLKADSAKNDQLWNETQAKNLQNEEKAAAAAAAAGLPPPPPEAIQKEEIEVEWLEIPHWMNGDKQSREIIAKFKRSLDNDFQGKGRLDLNVVSDHLWQVGLQIGQRWAGVPDETLITQNEELDRKCRHVQREALKETSALRAHVRKIEKKYVQAQAAAKKMQKDLVSAKSELTQAHKDIQMYSNGSSPPPQRVQHSSSGGFVGFSGGGGAPAGTVQGLVGVGGSPSPSRRGRQPTAGARGGGSRAGFPMGQAARSISSSGSVYGLGAGEYPARQPAPPEGRASSAIARAENAVARSGAAIARTERAHHEVQHLGEPGHGGGGPGHGGGGEYYGDSSLSEFQELSRGICVPPPEWGNHVVQPLLGDDSCDVEFDEEKLDEMDHELFEPLDQFDEDMKDLMIDCINEKVRRILSLDPSKYKNGKLPFGLKPYKGTITPHDDSQALEDELNDLKERYETLKEEKMRLESQLEAARNAAQKWKDRYNELLAKMPGEAPVVEEEEPEPVPIRRREIEKKEEPKEEPKPVEKPPPKKKEEPKAPQGISEEEVRRRIEKAEKVLKDKITALEKQLKEMDEEMKKLKARAEAAEAEAQAAKDAAAAAEAALKAKPPPEPKKEEPKPKKEVVKEIKIERAPPVPKSREGEYLGVIKLWNSANRQTVECLQKAVDQVASISGMKAPPEMETLKAFMKADESKPEEVNDAFRDNAPAIKQYIGKAMDKYRDSAVQPAQVIVQERAATPPPPPPPEKEVQQVVVEKGADPKDVMQLKRQVKLQQEELSRLLLTIDELRKRVEAIKGAALGGGPLIAGAVDNIMDQVGLKDIMEGGGAGRPGLKGVFERLYQDAVQRIQRYGLIRQQMIMANQAYAAVVSAMTQEKGQDGGPEEVPDFERLQSTTSATVRGMWYQTETLFKRACEYAMAQGVEASLLKAQRGSMADVMGMEDIGQGFVGGGGDDESVYQVTRMPNRLPARRSDRTQFQRIGDPMKSVPTAFGGRDVPAPEKLKKFRPSEPFSEPTPFTSYVAALREVTTDSAKEAEAWVREDRKSSNKTLNTLKAACAGGNVATGSPQLGAGNPLSRSLPQLPRGRNVLQQANDSEDITQ